MSNDKNVQNITDLGHQGSNFGEYNPLATLITLLIITIKHL